MPKRAAMMCREAGAEPHAGIDVESAVGDFFVETAAGFEDHRDHHPVENLFIANSH